MGLAKEKLVEFQRWTGKRKAEAVLDILSGKITLVDFCREHDLRQSEVEKWLKDFTKAGQSALTQGGKKDAKAQELVADALPLQLLPHSQFLYFYTDRSFLLFRLACILSF